MQSKYTYTLLSNNTGERLVLTNAPDGWDDTKVNVVRDMTYLGVLKTITVEFAFVGEGFKFMQRHRLRYGWDFSVILRVALRKGNVFQFEGKINTVPSGAEQRKSNKFKCDVIQSAAVQKFQNREDTEINALNNLSMDQQAVVPAQVRPALFRGKMIQFYSKFDGMLDDNVQLYHHVVPFNMVENGNPDVKVATGIQLDGNPLPEEPAPNNIHIVSSLPVELNDRDFAHYVNDLATAQSLKVRFLVNYTIGNNTSEVFPVTIDLPGAPGTYTIYPGSRLSFMRMNEDKSIDTVLWRSVKECAWGTFEHVYNEVVVLQPGQYLLFLNEQTTRGTGEIDTGGAIFMPATDPFLGGMQDEFVTHTYNRLELEITQDSDVEDSTHPVILPFELFQNLIAQINGLSFRSPVFGRTDLGYDVDGEFAYLAVTLGTWLRGIPVEETQFQTSLKSAFTSYSSVICLGLSIGETEIVIDKLENLFNGEINADLGEVEDFEITPLTEFMFNEIEAGFPTNEYEEQNGRDEFNTATVYTNSLQSYKKKLNIRSIYCGDGYGIEFSRRAGIVHTGSSDTRYDDKIFLVDCIPDGLNLMTRRMEGITLAEGMFSPETCLNLRIYPGQNMKRWAPYLNIPLDKKDKVLFFQSKDKNISTVIVTAMGATADGQDINLGSRAFCIPEAHNFKCPVKMIHLPGILANPLGLTKYTYEKENFYDYLLHIDAEREKGRATWKMMGTMSTPPDTSDNTIIGPFIKYGDGLEDFIKHADGSDDFIKYQD